MSLEQRRKNVVILFSSVACMAGPCSVFARRFPRLVWVWIALMALGLIYGGVEFRKLKKEERQ